MSANNSNCDAPNCEHAAPGTESNGAEATLPVHRPETFGAVCPASFTTPERMNYLDFLSLAPEAKPGVKPAVKRVLQADGANLILGTFQEGQALNDHRAAFPIIVQCLQGELEFTCGETTVQLRAGGAVHLPAAVVHRVDCKTTAGAANSVMLLTMLTGQA